MAGVVEHWWPVTHDFGLVKAPLDEAVAALLDAYSQHDDDLRAEPLNGPLEAVFERLLPLQFAYTRRLFVATDFGWTAYFTNGGAGSDPFPAMSLLARELDTTAMRICSTPAEEYHQATIWEVYGGPAQTDDTLGYVRSIAAYRNDGRWGYEESGEPLAFEDRDAAKARRKRDRFTPQMMQGYLAEFGIPPLEDIRLAPGGTANAVMIGKPTHRHLPCYDLEEAKARLRG